MEKLINYYKKYKFALFMDFATNLTFASFNLAIFKLLTFSITPFYINISIYCILFLISYKYKLYIDLLFYYYLIIKYMIPLHFKLIRIELLDDLIELQSNNPNKRKTNFFKRVKREKITQRIFMYIFYSLTWLRLYMDYSPYRYILINLSITYLLIFNKLIILIPIITLIICLSKLSTEILTKSPVTIKYIFNTDFNFDRKHDNPMEPIKPIWDNVLTIACINLSIYYQTTMKFHGFYNIIELDSSEVYNVLIIKEEEILIIRKHYDNLIGWLSFIVGKKTKNNK